MNDAQPLVTICMPVFNEEKFLAKAIENIQNQDYQNIEVLISDNCSTDKSFEIAQTYQKRDSRIVLSQNSENIGAAHNFNKLIKQGGGKYCMLVGAHDLRQHTMISDFVSVMESDNSISIVHPKAKWIDADGHVIGNINAELSTRKIKSSIARVSTVLFAHGYGSVVYGLMRYSQLRKVNLNSRIIAADILWMAEMSVFGSIVYRPSQTLYCRNTPSAGDWKKYVERIYGCSFDELSAKQLVFDMYDTFQRSLAKHYSEDDDQKIISAITVLALKTRYKSLLNNMNALKNKNDSSTDLWNDYLQNIHSEVEMYIKSFSDK